jgi:hypothetical protein
MTDTILEVAPAIVAALRLEEAIERIQVIFMASGNTQSG